MKVIALCAAIVACLAAQTTAVPVEERSCPIEARTTCTSPIVRKEWRTLTKLQKAQYLAAVVCLQHKASKGAGTLGGAKYLFDDFQAVHIQRTDFIHFTGQFQAWHRNFVAAYENALRTECSYSGAQPYWDWTLDAGAGKNFTASPVFDTPLGFGGNGPYEVGTVPTAPFPVPGRTGGGCQITGIFSKRNVTLGPGNSTAYNPHCLRRDFSSWLADRTLNTSVVNDALDEVDFAHFDIKVQGGVSVDPFTFTYHAGGHLGVGGEFGEVADVYSSPGDPIFFLHHANMDRLWWLWQKKNLAKRLTDIAGPVIQFDFPFNFTNFPPAYHGPQGPQTTLDFVLDFGVLTPKVKIRDVMNIKGSTLCYDYA